MHSNRGRYASKSADSPPTQNTSLPSAASVLEPVTGAPRKRIPCARASAAIFLENDGLDRKSTRLNSSHTVIYTLSLHDALPISCLVRPREQPCFPCTPIGAGMLPSRLTRRLPKTQACRARPRFWSPSPERRGNEYRARVPRRPSFSKTTG